MRASYDSIDNKQKMCEKVNNDITFIQFFHSTRLHSTELFKIFFSLLTLQLLFCKKLVGREKMFHCPFWVIRTEETKHIENKNLYDEFQRYILFFISVLWLAL